MRRGKRGRTRAIPLDEDTLAAITAWVKVRPTAATDHLLVSLPRTGQPPRPLGTRDTFCTHFADAGADTAVIRQLAGHADIRTTTIYTAVSDVRLEAPSRGRSQRHFKPGWTNVLVRTPT